MSRSNVARLVGSALTLAALAYFCDAVVDHWAQLAGAINRPIVAFATGAAILLGIVGYFLSAAGWARICSALGLNLRAATAFRIYFISQFGKYLPGNIGQHVGRLAMAMQQNLSGTAVVTSQLIEVLLVTGIFSLAAVMMLPPSYLVRWPLDQAGPWTIPLVLGTSLLVGTVAVLLLRRARRMDNVFRLIQHMIVTHRGRTRLLEAVGLIIANAVTTTIGLYLIAGQMADAPGPSIAEVGFAFIISWLIGFAAPGAPAGLGVRETVMLSLLSQTMDTSDAVATTLVFRLATTSTDLVAFLLGFCLRASPAITETHTP